MRFSTNKLLWTHQLYVDTWKRQVISGNDWLRINKQDQELREEDPLLDIYDIFIHQTNIQTYTLSMYYNMISIYIFLDVCYVSFYILWLWYWMTFRPQVFPPTDLGVEHLLIEWMETPKPPLMIVIGPQGARNNRQSL